MRKNQDPEYLRIKRMNAKRDLIPSPMSPEREVKKRCGSPPKSPEREVKKECLSPPMSPLREIKKECLTPPMSPLREIKKECLSPPMSPIRDKFIEKIIIENENLRKSLEKEKLKREHNYFLFSNAKEGRNYYYQKYKTCKCKENF